MGLDRRIGPKFLHPGPGYGGSCLPKDTNALLRIAEEQGIDLKVVSAAVIANEQQKEIMIRKIRSELGSLKGKTIAMLGISFKPNTDDVREAPSLYIMQTLLKDGAKIRAYDPAVKNRDVLAKNASSPQFTSRGIRLCRDAYDAAKGADALVLVTEWNQFRNLDLARIRKLLKNPCFFDLRNVYEPEKLKAEGFQYSCVGRV
jgi:UDPglucose 6-dehydrogenase